MKIPKVVFYIPRATLRQSEVNSFISMPSVRDNNYLPLGNLAAYTAEYLRIPIELGARTQPLEAECVKIYLIELTKLGSHGALNIKEKSALNRTRAWT